MADDATLEARLAEAEDALHRLMIGVQEVSVEYDGHSTTYARGSEEKLRRYIRDLRQQLGRDTGTRFRRVVY